MLPFPLLFERFAAFGLLVLIATLAGLPIVSLARCRLGWLAVVPVGIAYWSITLYVFPFRGGLFAALVLLTGLHLFAWRRLRGRRCLASGARLDLPAALMLIGGCLPFFTISAYQCVAPGPDSPLYATAARLILFEEGLPRTYAPFLPELSYVSVNVGLSAVAAVACNFGVSPEAATLAAEPLSYSFFILGCFLVLRTWVEPRPAAFLAVVAMHASRYAQMVVNWGGFPNLMAVAMGMVAVRMILDMSRRPRPLAFVPLGMVAGALPLVHGVGAASWVYVAVPVSGFVALRTAIDRRRSFRQLAAAAALSALVAAIYVAAESGSMNPDGAAISRDFVVIDAPRGPLWTLGFASACCVCDEAGVLPVCLGWLAIAFLLVRRRWRPALGLLAAQACLIFAIANSRLMVLPGSSLLYPRRITMWGTPIAVLALGFAWNSLKSDPRLRWGLALPVALLLTWISADRHLRAYQLYAAEPAISVQTYEALRWAGAHLDPHETMMTSSDQFAGFWFPSVACLAVTDFRRHHLGINPAETAMPRPPTHSFLVHGKFGSESPPPGTAIFRNDDVTILRLEPAPNPAAASRP